MVDAEDLVRTSWPAIGEVLFLVRIERVFLLAFYDRKEYLMQVDDSATKVYAHLFSNFFYDFSSPAPRASDRLHRPDSAENQ